MYLKAVRATLILVPLLGVQFVILPWRPSHPVLGKIYDFVMHSLIHFQVRGDVLSDSLLGEGGTMDAATLSATWSRGRSCPGLLCDESERFEHALPGREVAPLCLPHCLLSHVLNPKTEQGNRKWEV